jgi:hypothetical protein
MSIDQKFCTVQESNLQESAYFARYFDIPAAAIEAAVDKQKGLNLRIPEDGFSGLIFDL